MISAKRLEERIELLSKISEVDYDGVTRRALTKEDKKAQELVTSWMKQAGMSVQLDSAGNLIGRKEGYHKGYKPLVIGSHIDSVENGGKYDGTIGVIGGIEVVQHMVEEGIHPLRPIEIIAFCEEEGSRFQSGGLFGSQAMTGKISSSDLEVTDSDGITRWKVLEQFGLRPEEVLTNKVIRNKDEMLLYLEMHIEQGPILEKEEAPIGIVSHITGVTVFDIIVEGESNHAGTTPMELRHDALSGACEIKLALEKVALDYGSPAVGTVGRMQVYPGGVNIIPGKVMMSVDIRDIKEENREGILKHLKYESKMISEKRGLNIQFIERTKVKQANCSKEVIAIAKSEAKNMNTDFVEMVSGAGHDALLIAELCDIGMIFVRSQGGSHNPKETARIEDIVLGTELLYRVSSQYTI